MAWVILASCLFLISAFAQVREAIALGRIMNKDDFQMSGKVVTIKEVSEDSQMPQIPQKAFEGQPLELKFVDIAAWNRGEQVRLAKNKGWIEFSA